MDGEVDLEEVYAKRLRAVQPTRGQVQAIRQAYKRHIVEDAAAVVDLLQRLGHKLYIISGGLAEPVVEFGLSLGIPRERIRAVGIEYNALTGEWWREPGDGYPNGAERFLDTTEPALTVSQGKSLIARSFLAQQTGRSLLIGDGVSDLLAGQAVDLFVGFGGVNARPRVVAEAPVFIHSASLAPLLPLAAGPAALSRAGALADERDRGLVQKAFSLIASGAITFQNERLDQKFTEAYQAVHTGTDGS
jgi:phosphoserine phosphatase